jgi:hypothetical protein
MSRVEEALRRALSGSLDNPSRPTARDPEADRWTLKRYVPERSERPDSSAASIADSSPVAKKVTLGSLQTASLVSKGVELTEPKLEPASEIAKHLDAEGPSIDAQDRAPESGPDDSDEKVFDLRQVADYGRFALGSLRRHVILGAATFSFLFVMIIAALILLPKTYHAHAKLLAQRNAMMAALSNPGRAVPWDADAPTRAAAETVLRRDNLLMLIRQADLLNEWERTRIPLLKIKDWLVALITRRPTSDEKLDALLKMLEARLQVTGGPVGDGTVTIDLDWPNAQMAYRIVEAAQNHFVKTRQEVETATIGDSIGILERYAEKLHVDIDRTITQLQRAQEQHQATVPATAPPDSIPFPLTSLSATLPPVPAAALSAPALGANLDDPRLPQLKAAAEAKRRELTNLEEQRDRQLSEMQTRLAQLSLIYKPEHPTLLDLHRSIDVLSRDTPQLVALKRQTEEVEAEYQERLAAAEELFQVEQMKANQLREEEAKATATTATGKVASPRPSRPIRARTVAGGETTDVASVRFRLELNQLQSVLERIDGARIELAVSQAAFKYRYIVIRPADVPKEPTGPNRLAVLAVGLLGSLIAALGAIIGKDVWSNRIFELWQIERQLRLPILGGPIKM